MADCPVCRKFVPVQAIKGQEFFNRLEKPTPFNCPNCGNVIVFSGRTKVLFQWGMFVALIVSPIVYWLTRSFDVAMILTSAGLLVACVGILTQKLVAVGVDGIAEAVGRPLPAKRSAEPVVEGEAGRKVGLHVLSDFGARHEFISETPNRRLIQSTMRALDWETGFHQVILVRAPGVSMEVGGSLDPGDGLSSTFQDENEDVIRVTMEPPKTVREMEAILVSFMNDDGQWEQMFDYR